MATISEQLLAIPTWNSDLSHLRLTNKDIEKTIKGCNPKSSLVTFLGLEDVLTDRIEKFHFNNEDYQLLSSLIGCYASLEDSTKIKLLNATISGMSRLAKLFASESALETESIEATILLNYAIIMAAEKEKITQVGAKKTAKVASAEWNHLKIIQAESIKTICASGLLPRLYQTFSDMENVVSVLVKTAHALVENVENCKISQLRSACVDILVCCGSSLNYKNGLQIIICQDLNYLDHLAEFNAEVLAKMSIVHGDSTILDSILNHIGSIHFSQDDANAARIVCTFLIKLTISDTRDVLRNVASIADFLDSELYSVRMSMLEVFAILYCHLMLQDERSDQSRAQAKSFMNAIEQRLRDVNAFVRCKVLQVLSELIQANAIPIADRSALVDLVVGRVMDKSSNVRRKAIQLLGEFIRRHPFCVDGGELSLEFYQERLKDIDSQLDQLEPAEVKSSMHNSTEELAQDDQDQIDLGKVQTMQNLLLQKRYYSDAIYFVRQLDSVVPTLCRLLFSSTKTEVFEAMDFFVDAHIYKLQSSTLGIRKMMHLIWEHDLSTEDGTKRSIKEHVLENYRRILLEVDSRLTGKDKVLAIANNLISIVSESSTGDLASLEQVIAGFIKKGWIHDAVIQAIATLFTSKSSSILEQRSSLIILTMIGTFRPEALSARLDSILKVGLGSSISDPWIAEYSCVALKLLATASASTASIRLPNNNIIFTKLISLIASITSTPRWLQVVSEAIRTIYALADQPSLLASTLIHQLSRSLNLEGSLQIPTSNLIKLVFVVGQIASAEILHLDAVERHWKESKAKENSKSKQASKNDMEGVTATEEDDIVDAVRFMREKELLYGEGSLLTVFGSIVDKLLQNVAAMTLAKFMTVSGQFCDAHLPLFLTILEKSTDVAVRSNLTIAFADLAQSFGRIIDSNIVYLFRRLRDPEVVVKRNALLVLTHLTLTGLIKVKGQVGEIAKCILDEDPRVADLARLFFHELADKDNGVYNHIPDIISSLLSPDADQDPGVSLSEEDFQIIAKFIFDYIKKERQMEGLVEKLCQRFRQSPDTRQSRGLACCLTLINFTSERTTRKLIDALPLYKDKLIDPVVYRYFVEVLQKARKGTKAELRASLDEYEQRLLQAAGEETTAEVAQELNQLSLQKSQSSKAASRPRGRPPKTKIQRDAACAEDEDAMDIVSGDDELPKSSPRKAASTLPAKPVAAARKKSARRRIVMHSDDSNDSDEDVF